MDLLTRKKVNTIIHPVVRADFNNWVKEQKVSDLIFNEAAILFETEAYKNFDAIILVHAPEKVRVQRLMKRDGSSPSEIKIPAVIRVILALILGFGYFSLGVFSLL